MSIYKTEKSPFWQYSFDVKGHRFHGSTGTGSKEEAKIVEADERSKAVARIRNPEQADMSLDIAADRYWMEHARHKKSAADIREKLKAVTRGIGPAKMLRSITNMDITDYIARRRGEMKKVKEGEKTKLVRVRGDSSVNREITLLRALLTRASTAWDIDIKMPNWKAHKLAEPRGRLRSLTGAEEKKLFAHLRADFHPLVRFCLITGARVTSTRKLTWKQVDIQAREIRLEVKSKFLGEFHTLPIIPQIEALLASLRGQHPIFVFTYMAARKPCEKPGNVKRQKGHRYPFQRDGWRRVWAKALKDAGIEDFRFHDLRHTAATQMLRATQNLAAVQKVLGHRDVNTTMRYAHVMKDDIHAALAREDHRKITGNEDDEKKKAQLKIVSSNG